MTKGTNIAFIVALASVASVLATLGGGFFDGI
jgi:hypothetical protein